MFCKKAYLFLCVVVSNLSLFAQTGDKIDSLENVLKVTQSYEEFCASIDELTFHYYHNQPDSAIYYCNVGIPRSIIAKDTSGVGYYHMFIGVCYKDLTQYDSAIYHLNESIYYRKLVGFEAGIAGAYNNLGTVYQLKGNYEKAIVNFMNALEIFSELEDNKNIGEVNSNLGELYIEMDEFDLAKSCFESSREGYIKEGNPLSLGWYYNDLALLKTEMEELDSALIYYQKAIDIWKPKERIKEYSNCVVKMAEIELYRNNFEIALGYLNEAEINFSQIQYEAGLTDVYLKKGDYFLKTGELNEATIYYKKSLEKADISKANSLLRDIYYGLYQTFKKKNNHSEALKYLEQYNALNDSIFGLEQEKIKQQYQSKYDLFSKEAEIQELTKSEEIQGLKVEQSELENEKQRIGIYALSGGVLLVGVFVYLLYRRNKVKTQLNEELERSLKEREALLREIHHRVKNNLQIVSSLLNLQSGYATQKSADEILKDSQDRINSMSILHENLYQSEALNEINFKEYVEKLVVNLKKSFDLDQKNITVVQAIDKTQLDMDFLVPCGLIINELVTNSLKYAFKDNEQGVIKITGIEKKNVYHLSIEDDGVGMDVIEPAKLKSLGLRLVSGLVRQMKGEISFPKTDKGIQVNITFKI